MDMTIFGVFFRYKYKKNITEYFGFQIHIPTRYHFKLRSKQKITESYVTLSGVLKTEKMILYSTEAHSTCQNMPETAAHSSTEEDQHVVKMANPVKA